MTVSLQLVSVNTRALYSFIRKARCHTRQGTYYFKDMSEILLVFDSPYTLALAGGETFSKDGAELKPGKYYCRR